MRGISIPKFNYIRSKWKKLKVTWVKSFQPKGLWGKNGENCCWLKIGWLKNIHPCKFECSGYRRLFASGGWVEAVKNAELSCERGYVPWTYYPPLLWSYSESYQLINLCVCIDKYDFMFWFLQIQSSNISSSGCSKEISSFLTTLFGEGHPNDVIEAEKDKYLKFYFKSGEDRHWASDVATPPLIRLWRLTIFTWLSTIQIHISRLIQHFLTSSHPFSW